MVESLDLALLSLSDPSFGDEFHAAICKDNYDPNAFWQTRIARGALGRRLREALLAVGASTAEVDAYVTYSRQVRMAFSGSTHGSARSALLSLVIPSLSHPDGWGTQFLGCMSEHAPEFLLGVAHLVHLSAQLIVGMLVRDSPVPALQVATGRRWRARPFITAFLVLQECLLDADPPALPEGPA